MKELTKRINSARESGYTLEEDCRSTMMGWHSSLLQEKSEADRLAREILSYLKSKYNRPHQLVGSVLKIGYDLKPPGTDRKLSKANCLIVLEIRRDLKKYRMQAKIDLYYINTIAPRCLTEEEFSRS